MLTLETNSPGAVVPEAFETAMEELSRRLSEVRGSVARVLRAREGHEVAALRARVPALATVLADASSAVSAAAGVLEATPAGGAVGPGYAPALEAEFRRAGLEFEGAFPEYEIFPVAVRVGLEAEVVRIGRKAVQTLDPRAVAKAVQAEHRRLHRSSFNAERFLRALTLCYDALSGGEAGAAVLLLDVYKLLSARTGSAGYTRQEFAFDIYRLRRQSDMVVDGKRVEFVHGKKGGARIAVPRAQGGVEEFTALVMTRVFGYA